VKTVRYVGINDYSDISFNRRSRTPSRVAQKFQKQLRSQHRSLSTAGVQLVVKGLVPTHLADIFRLILDIPAQLKSAVKV
jgi:hypothetical protein